MGKEQNLHRRNEDLALLMRLLLSLNLKFLKLKLEKPVIYNGSSCPHGLSCQGWHELSALLWSRTRTSERRCIRPVHLAIRIQSPCSSWSPQHASLHRPQMPAEPPCRLSLAIGLLKQTAWKTLHIWLASFGVLSWMSWPKSSGHINHRNKTTETKPKKVSSRDLSLSLQLCFFLYLCLSSLSFCLFLFSLCLCLSSLSLSIYLFFSSEISQHEIGMMIQIILFWSL